jgi:Family of unknown function (DUF5989)
MNSVREFVDLQETLLRCHNCGQLVEDVDNLINREASTLMIREDIGLWALMKANKLWLLPIIIVVIFIGTLTVWTSQSVVPPSPENICQC